MQIFFAAAKNFQFARPPEAITTFYEILFNEIKQALQTQPAMVIGLLDMLRARLVDLQDKFEPFVKASAKALVTNQQLLFEISRFGFEKALTVLPDEPTIAESFKIMKLLDQLLGALQEKRDKLETSMAELDIENFLAGNPTQSDIRDRITAAISILQMATDKEAMVILTQYFLKENNGQRPDWVLNFTGLNLLDRDGRRERVEVYQEVRPAVKNIIDLFTGDSNIKFYEDKRYQRLDLTEINGKKEGNTDYLYLSSSLKLEAKCLTCLVVDEWQEFLPNQESPPNTDMPEKVLTETTGIAFRYDSPQTEAPNAILLAVPPEIKDENWTIDLLANTILETIELLQIRMVGSDEIIGSNNLGRFFPALLFYPDKGENPFFPFAKRPLYDFNIGASFYYALVSEFKSEKLQPPEVIASRK